MRKITLSRLCAASLLTAGAGTTAAAQLTVEVTNLTHAIYFTPLLVAAHDGSSHLFEVGQAASTSLQAMAEGGDIAGLTADAQAIGASVDADPAAGLLAPGQSATTGTLNTDGTDNGYLSIVGMLLPTNDGFAGLDAWPIPEAPGTYTLYLNGYDAGTEGNDELINTADGGVPGTPGIPADPTGQAGSGGTGVTSVELNATVHVHRGNLGDTDPVGGPSDLDSTQHRWQNPVARVTVTVQ
jgi:hypothetical protein